MASSISPNCNLNPAAHKAISLRRRSISAVEFILSPSRSRNPPLLLCRSTRDGTPDPIRDNESFKSTYRNSGDAYVGVFVRMLGIDNDPLDREQAINALWKYSQGGNNCIDAIMKFRGCISLTVNLLRSDSSDTCEAAAGLLQTISSVNLHRDSVAECGAIEEISALLTRPNLTAEVKEQSICTLWNLSVDKKLRMKIANLDLLLILVKFLNDEEMKVKEAAGGVLANLALCSSNHGIMVEAGVIQKLGELLRSNIEDGSKVIRKEAKNVLLELAGDKYYRILILEEGLVRVPLVGAEAYKSFRPVSHTWPSLPDGTQFERSSPTPSRYGASELLLGLNAQHKSVNLDDAKLNAIVGRSHQHFLARIGAIEMEEGRKSQVASSLNQQFTLLPWMDGIARLVLILGLKDESAIERAAESIADVAINESMRISFKEAGAVKILVQLLNHYKDSVRFSAAHALERLSVSSEVCKTIEVEDVVDPLVNILKNTNMSQSPVEKALNILSRIFDPSKEMKTKMYGPVNGVNGLGKVSYDTNQSPVGIKDITITPDDLSELKAMTRENILDSTVISCLVEIMKSPSANLQTKAASILEYLSSIKAHMEEMTSCGIESAVDAVFQQNFIEGLAENEDNLLELNPVKAEEAGLTTSAASRLLLRLLNSEQFRTSIDSTHFILVLRKLLKLNIPLHTKELVAASLIKLESLAGSNVDPENPINMEVTMYETIPRLVEQIKNSFSLEEQEASVIELNEIISKGVVDYTRAVAAQGAIFPLVKLIEEVSEQGVEAILAVLYNLSMDAENHTAIVAAGAVPILRRIVISEGPQWRRALHLLWTLPTW